MLVGQLQHKVIGYKSAPSVFQQTTICVINSFLSQEAHGVHGGFSYVMQQSVAVQIIKIRCSQRLGGNAQFTEHEGIEREFGRRNANPATISASLIAHHVDVHVDDFHRNIGKKRQMAEGVGFEPTERLPVHSISNRAPSTGLSHPSTRRAVYGSSGDDSIRFVKPAEILKPQCLIAKITHQL